MSPADSPFASVMSRKSRHDWQAAVRPETAVAASTVDVFSPRPNKYWWPGGRNPVRGKHGSKECLSHCVLQKRLRPRSTSSRPPTGPLAVGRSLKVFSGKQRSTSFPTTTSPLSDVTHSPKTSLHGRMYSRVARVKRRSLPTCRTDASMCRACSRAGTRLHWRGCPEHTPRVGGANAPSHGPFARFPRPVYSGRSRREPQNRRGR